MRRILTILLFLGISLNLFAQPVDYTVRVLQTQWFSTSACSETGTEEYTAKAWFFDNLNGTNVGGTCITCNNNGNCTNNTDYTLGTRTNTCASTVSLRFQAWEDDRGGRCDLNINGGIFDNDDDCHCGISTVANINFRNSGPGCTTYGYYGCNTSNHRFLAQICWSYAAGAPTNATCGTATPVTVGNTAYTLPASTCGTDITSCTFNDNDALWYAYTPQCSYNATIATCGSSYDTALSVWSTCTSGELACNDDACGLQSSITLNVTQGTTYYIRVSGYNSASGGGTLNISAPPVPAVQGFGCNQWNVNVYNGNAFNLASNVYTGYYVEGNLTYDTRNRYCSNCSPAAASGYTGCDPGPDIHTVVSKRTCFPCGTYQIDVPNHDDGAYLYINGALVWSHAACCDSHTNVWTGTLNNSSTVEMRHYEGSVGSHQGLRFINVTSALQPGSVTTNQTLCPGGDPGTLTSSSNGSGGVAPISYQWQQSPGCNGSWANISGATGTTYNPPALNQTTCYRRVVTDVCGTNSNTNIITITIADTTPPIITCPGNQTINANTNCEANLGNYTMLASTMDNCPGTISVTQSPSSGSTISGPTLVTLTATDAAGNSSTCAFSVSLNDVTPPTISCPSNLTVNSDAGACNAAVNFMLPTTMDNCPLLTFTQGNVTYSYIGTYNGHYYYLSDIGLSANAANTNAIAAGNTYGLASHLVTIDDATEDQLIFDAAVSNNTSILIGYTDEGSEGSFGWFGGCCGGGGSGYINWAAGEPNNINNEDYTHVRPILGGAWNDFNNNMGSQFVIEMNGSPKPLVTCSANSGDTFPVGTTTVTCTTTDSGGNSNNCSFSITVVDNEPPTLSCPAPITQNTTNGCTAPIAYAISSSDNCAGQTVTQTAGLPSGAFFPLGTTTNAFTATDASGNTTTCSFTVTITDNMPPTISCPSNITQGVDPGVCGATITYLTIAADNCPGFMVNQTSGLPSGSVFPVGTTTNSFTVTDGAGNTANCSFTITITDQEDPVINCPATISQGVDAGNCGAVVNFTVPYSDNCLGSTIVQLSGQVSGTTFPVGTTTNAFRVTDASGNTATCSFDVVITDDENPTINCPSNINQSNDPGICGAVINYPVPYADNCPGETIVQTSGGASGTLFPIGTTTNSFTVTDGVGNTITCSFDITISDTEDPVINCPATINQAVVPGSCSAVVNYSVTTSDNCPGEQITQTAGLPDGATFPIGTTTNAFLVTDASGNTSTCSFEVIISDNEDPTISCPSNITQNNTPGDCGTIVNYNVTSGDNCMGQTVMQTTGLASGANFPVGTTTNTFVVTDVAGNTATCSFDVIIIDNENPTISCPAAISQGVDTGVCGATINYTVTSTDNCPGETVMLTSGLASGSVFPVGTTTNIYMVTDLAGNTATCSFDVTIVDDEDPTASCPPAITRSADPGACGSLITFNVPPTDNCPGTTVQQTSGILSGTIAPIGTITNTFVLTDAAGNTSSCSFDVTVTDDEFPVLNCIPNLTVQLDPNSIKVVTVNDLTTSFSDNCNPPVVQVVSGQTNFDCDDVGQSFTLVIKATDASGNMVSCQSIVTIADDTNPCNLPPTAVCQNLTLPADMNCQGIADAIDFDNGSSDPEMETLLYTVAPTGPYPIGTTAVVLTVTDPFGVSASCNATITITDQLAPTLSCPAPISQNADPGQCSKVITYTVSSSDNCPGQMVTQTAGLASGAMFPIGTTINAFMVTDAAGNTATCSFEVTILDGETPEIICPAPIVMNSSPGSCDAIVNYSVSTDDNCPGETLTQTAGLPSGSIFPVGITTNTFVVTDGSGNTASCSFDVEIADGELPTTICPTTIQQPTTLGGCSALVNYATPIFNDNCDGTVLAGTLISGLTSGSTFPLGTTTVTYAYTDMAGNGPVICSFDVTVVDEIAPTANCQNLAITLGANGSQTITAADIDNGSSDNCAVTSLSLDKTVFDCTDSGVTPVILTVMDASGNMSTCAATVTLDGTPIPTFNCPTTLRTCDGTFACNFNDQNPVTVNLVSASVSGSAAQYLQGNISPGGNAYFDPLTMPRNVPLTLTYTLTIGPCNTVSSTCTFTVLEVKASNAGGF